MHVISVFIYFSILQKVHGSWWRWKIWNELRKNKSNCATEMLHRTDVLVISARFDIKSFLSNERGWRYPDSTRHSAVASWVTPHNHTITHLQQTTATHTSKTHSVTSARFVLIASRSNDDFTCVTYTNICVCVCVCVYIIIDCTSK